MNQKEQLQGHGYFRKKKWAIPEANTFDEIDNELFKALQAEIDDMKKMLFDEFKTKGHAKLNGSDEGSSD